MKHRTLLRPAWVGAVAAVLVACESAPGQSGHGGDTAIVVGTTDTFAITAGAPAPFDPAAAYDISGWNVMRNTFQTLLHPPRSGTEPALEAAKKCGFTDRKNEQYRCTLRGDLKFSSGREVTAADVEFSITRVLDIAYENGPVSLLSNVDTVEAISEREVVFHLRTPDATFPYKLATPAAAIVDRETYPAKKLLKGFRIMGSGPYVLNSIDMKTGKAVLTRNPHYEGALKIRNEQIDIRFFKDSKEMEKSLAAGEIDVMNRSVTPRQIDRLKSTADDMVNVVEAPGQEVRYLIFTTDAPAVRDTAVRRAVAQVIDRKTLVRDVYKRTAEPLYSVVPTGVPGHHNSFFNVYGEPDVAAARRILAEAGMESPVKLRLTYTNDHYGAVTAAEFRELRRQLNSSGLFDVTIRGVPWATFRPAASEKRYDIYGMGWFPDFPDPENYIAPFFGADNILNSPYRSSVIHDVVIPETRRTAQRSAALKNFVRAQNIVARDVPLIPLWQGKQYVAAREDITGVEWALSTSSVLQLWELGRGVAD